MRQQIAIIRNIHLRCLLLLILPLCMVSMAAASLPDWLKTAMAQNVDAIAKDAAAVQIVDYMSVAFSNDGISRTENRSAIRILTADGIQYAKVKINFNVRSDKVTDLHAWLILPDGKIREYEDKDFIRVEASEYFTLYTENANRWLDLTDAAKAKCVFAYTYKLKSKEVVTDTVWFTRQECPILSSNLFVTVPKGWQVRSVPVNKPEVVENFDGKTYACVSVNQPAIKPEPMSPPGTIGPNVIVTVLPTSGDLALNHILAFSNWNDVAKYDSLQNDSQAQPDAAIRAKTAALTAGCETLWKMIQAVCAYVQKVNYISVNKDLATGGGYKPNSAASVFAHNYGDCKDKTALLRAMLSCIGVESYATSCLADDERTVNPSFPSEFNFNHCIAAIRVPEDIDNGAIVKHPELGRLLIFDPTDDIVPVGFISKILSNTYFLVGSDSCKSLALFPVSSAQNEENTVVSLDAAGSLSGTLTQICGGKNADWERALFRAESSEEYKRTLTEWLRSHTVNTTLDEWSVTDDLDLDHFAIHVKFDAPNYARHIGAKKMLLKAFVPGDSSYVPDKPQDGKRIWPFVVPLSSTTKDTLITLPEGYVVDELPRDITVEENYGTIELRSSVEGNVVHVRVVTKTQTMTLPPENYERLRAFYKTRDKVLQATLVVRRSEEK